MINRWIRIFLLMVLATVYGCDGILYNRDPLYQKLLDMELNQTTRVDSLIDGEWEYVCVLTPYQGSVLDLESDAQAMKIDNYIDEKNIPTDEGHWNLVFSNENNFYLINFKISKKLHLYQNSYHDELLIKNLNTDSNLRRNLLVHVLEFDNFIPKLCVPFDKAFFLKHYRYNRVQITLGELKK